MNTRTSGTPGLPVFDLTKETDDRIIGRGRYANLTPKQLLSRDPGYLVWAYENWDRSFWDYDWCSKDLYEDALLENEANKPSSKRGRSKGGEDEDAIEDTFDRFKRLG